MKKILLFFTIFIPLMIAAETVVPPGPVSGHWKLSYSPYVITGDIYIEEGETLILYPGVELLFKGEYKLEVFGSLLAEGLESSKIHFTTYDGVNIWSGIRFMESTSSSIIDHCTIEWAFSNLSDTVSLPENCGGGIFCYNSPEVTITITNTLIQDCRAVYGGGIMCYNSNVIIENCELKNNLAARGGGIMLYGNAQTVIKHSRIFNNQATFDGGGIGMDSTTNIVMQRTQVAHNNAARGGGLYFEHSDGDFCGNTIAKNTADEDGGGIYFTTASSPNITNTVIYTNTDGTANGGNQIFLGCNNCDPDFYHCNIYGGLEGFEGPGVAYFTGLYEHCVSGDPKFKNAAACDFTITWENYPYDDNTKSGCVDNGCPEQGLDPDQSCCDIGVYSYFQVLNKPVELYGDPLTCTTFLASWNSCYGALGYLVDVAYDHGFNNFILEGARVSEPVTELEVTIPQITELVYLRVRSFNTGLTSEYSDDHVVLWVSVDEPEEDVVQIFSSATGVHINTTRTFTDPGEVRIYSLSGQLLGHYSMRPGNTTIDPGFANQVIIVNVILDGEVYQQKLLLH